MHISEGVLSAPVLIAGGVLAVAGTAVGLKKIEHEHIALVGILSAVFFVASLVHVPVGPSSVHLILNGLAGLLLGWTAVPALLVALLLQAVLFQFGGITTLGVNTVTMALPAVACSYLFTPFMRKNKGVMLAGGFACGFFGVLFAALLAALALASTGKTFYSTAALIMAAHLPVMLIEGAITMFCVAFLEKVMPEMLPGFMNTDNKVR